MSHLTRVSPLRVGIVLLCTALVGWTGTRAISAAVTTPAKPGSTTFAGYVDVTATPTYPFETPPGPAQSSVILSFVVAGPGQPCTAMWGGVYTLGQAASRLDLDRRMSQLRLVGGQARASFGGQAGKELATTCTDPAALGEAYQSVVDRYKLTSIDLDLEGASLEDAAAATRRATAIKEVQGRAKAAGRDVPAVEHHARLRRGFAGAGRARALQGQVVVAGAEAGTVRRRGLSLAPRHTGHLTKAPIGLAGFPARRTAPEGTPVARPRMSEVAA